MQCRQYSSADRTRCRHRSIMMLLRRTVGDSPRHQTERNVE